MPLARIDICEDAPPELIKVVSEAIYSARSGLELLEKRVGSPLLRPSTGALSLADAGRHYFERVRPIVRDAHRPARTPS
jgi:hypothetical protein